MTTQPQRPHAAAQTMAAPLQQLANLMNGAQFAEAEIIARRLIDQHPDVGALWKLYGSALLMQEKEAVPALKRAASLLPNDAQTQFFLATALQDHAEFSASLPYFQAALAIDPQFAEGYEGLGLALHQLGNFSEAVAAFHQAIALRPDFARTQGFLGNALLDLKRPVEAEVAFRQWLTIEPDEAEAHNALGNALRALGRYEEAISSFERALSIRPRSPGVLLNLATALRDVGRLGAALECCERAHAMNADIPELHRTTGNILFDLGRFDLAETHYREALRLDARFASGYAALAMLLRQMGRSAEAGAACQRALQLDPASTEALALSGEIHADQGQFREALETFRRALAIYPDLPEGWAGLARYRRMTEGDQNWRVQAERVLKKPLALQHRANLQFALGKYFDDLGDPERAFESFRNANESSKRYGIRHDRAAMQRRVDALIATQTDAWIQAHQAYGNSSETPVFVVGMPRSGTTLVEQIIASHPDAFGAGELRYWHAAAVRIDAALAQTLSKREAMAQAASDYLLNLRQLAPQALRVVDKMPANYLNLGLIHAALPRARIVHVQRHPIDTCLSIYFQIFSNAHTYANDLHDLAHQYQQYRRLMRHWEAILPAESLFTLPYESLVEDPERWTRRLLQFIGLPWNTRCLDFHLTERTVQTASNWQVRQKMSSASVGRWLKYCRFLDPLLPLLSAESRESRPDVVRH